MRAYASLPVLEEPPHSRDLWEETGGACLREPGPCGRLECRFHLREPRARQAQELAEPCAMKVADRGPFTLDEIGRMLGVTRERVRQVEMIALEKVGRRMQSAGWRRADINSTIAANEQRR